MTSHWWVNHKKTFKHEVTGGFIWSPKKNQDGSNNETYSNLKKVSPGDVIFSFADTEVRAVGIALAGAQESPKPAEFGAAGDTWGDIGWYVPVDFRKLTKTLKPQQVAGDLAPTLPEKYSPIRADGKGNQGVYLAAVPHVMAQRLRGMLGGQVEAIEQNVNWHPDPEQASEAAEKLLEQRIDIGPTQKDQLVKARRGQGVYRSNLEQIETGCRVTGVTERTHLRASHIKPWKDSTDAEKLDGNNGLLLAPHIDHLFDRGYISFSDAGEMLVSKSLDVAVLKRWSIDTGKTYGPFNAKQGFYLQYHRDKVFR